MNGKTHLIRPFVDDDYPEIVDVHNSVYPEYKISVEELKKWDGNREDKIIFGRFVCEKNHKVVATGVHDQSSHFYHPGRFWCIRIIDGRGSVRPFTDI